MSQVGTETRTKPPHRKVAAAATRRPYPVLTLRETLIFPLKAIQKELGEEDPQQAEVKEKVLSAHRAGLRTVLASRRNEADLEELPEQVRREMHFVALDSLEEALEMVLTSA